MLNLNSLAVDDTDKAKRYEYRKEKKPIVESVSDNDDRNSDNESDEDEVDDQTQALLKGFESDDDDEKDPEDQGFEAGQTIPKLDKAKKKKIEAAQGADESDKPG